MIHWPSSAGREMWGDVARCGEMWGDVGRYRETWPSSAGRCTEVEAPLTTLTCSTAEGSVSGKSISAPRSKVKYTSPPVSPPPGAAAPPAAAAARLSSLGRPSPVWSCSWRTRTMTRGRSFGRWRSPRTPWIWMRSTLGSLSALR